MSRRRDKQDGQRTTLENLPFTVKHRSNLKGLYKIPFEYYFLNNETSQDVVQMRKWCINSTNLHKIKINDFIEKLRMEFNRDIDVANEKEHQESVANPVERTIFELQCAMYHNFDIRKHS